MTMHKRFQPRVSHCTVCSAHAAHAARKRSVVVVGGGVGGLVSAGLLAKAGVEVTLLEKNDQVGGRMQSLQQDGFRFDTGPSLLLFPDTYKETFRALGEDIADWVDVVEVRDAAYRVHYADATHADLLYNVHQMCRQLDGMESGAGSRYLEWLGSARTALSVGMDNFIRRDFDGWADLLRPGRLLAMASQVNLLDMLGQHNWRLSTRFRDPRLCALFSLQDLYVGLTPYNAPSVFSLLAATEITDGVWYPVGGFQKVRDALLAIAVQHGVTVRTGCEVSSIECGTPGARTVRCADGTAHTADGVLCNADVASALHLVRHPRAASKAQAVADKAYSASVVEYRWTLDRELPGLRHHNVFLSGDWQGSWDRAVHAGALQARPNFYVHCPRQTDATAAPAGCESVMVLLPVANLQERAAAGVGCGPEVDADLVAAGRNAILRAFEDSGIGSVEAAITHESVVTPHDWQANYGLQHGAVFGMTHSLDQLALLRPALRDPNIPGLFFVGASTRPGNGVPLCMLSGQLAAQRVLEGLQETGATE